MGDYSKEHDCEPESQAYVNLRYIMPGDDFADEMILSRKDGIEDIPKSMIALADRLDRSSMVLRELAREIEKSGLKINQDISIEASECSVLFYGPKDFV
ncbi:MAG: hypothetical protein Q7K45_05125, partial [Nanoarchaeota archaeon]|nr:hypothetical protein [Nanoarchaeota archaeon]